MKKTSECQWCGSALFHCENICGRCNNHYQQAPNIIGTGTDLRLVTAEEIMAEYICK